MEKSKLLKCPFCGEDVSIRRNFRTGHTAIQCDYCRAWWTPAEHLTRNEITEAWNRFWMNIEINCSDKPCSKCPASDGDKCGHWEGTCGRSLRKKYESIAGTPPSENAKEAVLPIPCTKGFENWTVKQWFAKINEELDELKEAVGSPMLATPRELYSVTWSDFSDRAIEERCKKIAEEAADTITAITSMLEAMGIDEQKRQAAQRRVNEHNLERGRF